MKNHPLAHLYGFGLIDSLRRDSLGTPEVCLDGDKAARFNVSAQSTGGLGRFLLHTERGLPLLKTPKRRSWPCNHPEPGECRMECV